METSEQPHLPTQQAGAVYRQFLNQLRLLTGASGASLFIDSPFNAGSRPLLVHSSGTEAIPEFESIDSARRLIRSLSQLPDQANLPVIQAYPSDADQCRLVRIQIEVEAETRLARQNRERRRVTGDASDDQALWLALRYDHGDVPAEVEQLQAPAEGTPANPAAWLAQSLISSATMVWEANQLTQLLRDPTSQLPGRAEFQAKLRVAMESAHGRSTLGLLLVNPDDFDQVNRRLDRDSGDAALAEIAVTLCDSLRASDTVFRYGGAVFAVQMPGASRSAVLAVAEKIRESLTGAYLNGAMRLTFSIGSALYDPEDSDDQELDELTLVRRADQALNLAKGKGGDCTVFWEADEAGHEVIGRDRLSGIFTADVEKDYRNMLVLWDTIALVSSATDELRLAAGFVDRIDLAMQTRWVALFSSREGGAAELMAESGRAIGVKDGRYPADVLRLVGRAREMGRIEHALREPVGRDEENGESRRGYAIPLLLENRVLACLYLEGPEGELVLDSSDLAFLNALAGQVALALDRADLASRWQAEKERESRRLRSEVHGLRQVVQSARMVYTSRQMDAVLETARAAAPTDVTVLINGESGTGKEMLARSVHELSARKGKPFVTVDCGSIASNLIEAELFGASKGAFTGAEKATQGRIVQADGGTLFLDEIGEVPLDVQVKLLRFVQEKEIHPVGAATARRVDVRIIAATNRDLAREAAAGRFREDLYYRLNVVTLTAPPLRDRPDDILPLAGHFLEKFALQYDKGARRFSAAAERLLQSYSWPGNVRELQNGILRAVVLSTEDVIDIGLLVFEDPADGGKARSAADFSGIQPPPSSDEQASPPPPVSPGLSALPELSGEPWQALSNELENQVDSALEGADLKSAPLGRWLYEDLVLTVDEIARGTARRGARRLGIAETTYRRQLEKARSLETHGLLRRSGNWSRCQPYIAHLADSLSEDNDDNVVEKARTQLLKAVVAKVGGNAAAGAALMGITVPTYHRWLDQI